MRWPLSLLLLCMTWTTQVAPTASCAMQEVSWPSSTMTQLCLRATMQLWPSRSPRETISATSSRTLNGTGLVVPFISIHLFMPWLFLQVTGQLIDWRKCLSSFAKIFLSNWRIQMHFKWGSGSHSDSVHPVFVLCIIRMTWLSLTNIHLCVCVCLCEFKTEGQNNVVLVPKWGRSCVLPSSDEVGGYGGEGANKASIHCHCHCRKNRETVHTAFHAIYHSATFLCFVFACCLSLHHLWPSLPPPGTNIEHSDRLSLIWFSQQRWPSTLNMSTSLSTASTSHWPLWRRMGWALKTKRRKCCWLGKFDVSSFCLIFYFFYLRLFF